MQSYTADTDLASIKLIATDMDLTLLHDDKTMPAGVPERIERLRACGVQFCAASGRPAPSLRHVFGDNAQDMAFICDNGASVYQGEHCVYRDLIDNDLYHEVLALASDDPREVPVLCCFDEAYALERDRGHQDEIGIYYRTINFVESFEDVDAASNKISIYFPGWDSKRALDEKYASAFGERLYLTCAGNEWLDFMNLGVDKGSGIRHLAEHLGIELADIAAFGDTYNDIPMLDIVGHSFVMANAAEHMHEHARYLAPSNQDEGVLTVIDAILAAKQA